MDSSWRRVVSSAGETLRAAALASGLARAPESPAAPLLVDPAWTGRLGRGRFTVGRAFDCDRRIDDPAISRHHLELRYEDERWIASDLHSLNGVYLNGRRIWRAAVEAGDELVLGGTRLVFQPGSVSRADAGTEMLCV